MSAAFRVIPYSPSAWRIDGTKTIGLPIGAGAELGGLTAIGHEVEEPEGPRFRAPGGGAHRQRADLGLVHAALARVACLPTASFAGL